MSEENLLIKTSTFSTLSNMFNLTSQFNIIAGPCSIESIEQMETVARRLIDNRIHFIRGGAFKPRTSPYDFQGLEIKGLEILRNICRKYSLYSVSEIVDVRDIELGIQYIDIIQIGSRNMTNFPLLKEIGKTDHPVLLKRGMMSTLKEFLLATEYILQGGNRNVILCERGIRTFEDSTRNTLDISSIAIIKNETNIPVIVDLSHSLGRKDIIIPVTKAVFALDADGIMLEVHNDPQNSLSDKEQQLSTDEFQEYYNWLKVYMDSTIQIS